MFVNPDGEYAISGFIAPRHSIGRLSISPPKIISCEIHSKNESFETELSELPDLLTWLRVCEIQLPELGLMFTS